jgi:hypothetical protein
MRKTLCMWVSLLTEDSRSTGGMEEVDKVLGCHRCRCSFPKGVCRLLKLRLIEAGKVKKFGHSTNVSIYENL